MIDKEHPLPISKQCHILQLSRSNLYYMPAPVNDNDRELMRIIDEPLKIFWRLSEKS
jgi:putative transposase